MQKIEIIIIPYCAWLNKIRFVQLLSLFTTTNLFKLTETNTPTRSYNFGNKKCIAFNQASAIRPRKKSDCKKTEWKNERKGVEDAKSRVERRLLIF